MEEQTRLKRFMTLLYIKIQVRMIKYKVSVLNWQFDRIMKKLELKITSNK